jgi:two-component system phosphate regulon sensor histidine kinase PhoR
VSHELKTPITSIKGAVETLLDGAIRNPDEARSFLEIIERHGIRMERLVEDLLTISRIEYESEREQIVLDRQSLNSILQAAVQACRERAAARKVTLTLSADAPLVTRVSAPLMEQAIVNLIDNAIQYSAEGGEVSIRGFRQEGEFVVRVEDQGLGIESRHLPRLFERFYRADMARSRKVGGTGLGLAIVKHVVLAHKGRVTVESTPGKGSIFSIHLAAEPVAKR